MALQKDFTLKNGLVIPNAYIKIETCTSTKESASARVGVYVNKAYAEQGEAVFEHYHIFKPNYSTDAINLWEQAYEFIKTLPEYEGAENV